MANHRSRILLQVMAASFVASLSQNSIALTPSDIFRLAQDQVVVLDVLNESGQVLSSNTALLIDNHKAVTQCDLLSGADSIRLTQGSATFPAKLDKKDGARNLCLLSVPGANFPSAHPGQDDDPVIGSKIYAVSNALGLGLSISEGVVAGIREFGGESYIQFTAAIAPGSTGGGLFDADGNLIGLINYRLMDGQNVNFAIPSRWLAQIEQRAGSTDAAAAMREQALTMQRDSKWQAMEQHATAWTKALPDSSEAWLFLGNAQVQLKKWDAAEISYHEALKHDPASTAASQMLGMVLLQQKKPQEALDVARAQLAYRQEYTPIWLVIAYAENMLGNLDAAKKSYERITQLDPQNKEAYQGLATLAHSRSDLPAQIAAQRQIVRIDPQDAEAWLRLADGYLQANRASRALSSAEHAIELTPASGDAWYFKGASLMRLKRYLEAIDALQKSLGFKPLKPDWPWEALGIIYNQQKLYPEAIAAYREALKLDPSNLIYKNNLGMALKDGLHHDEALALFEELRENNPNDPFPWRQIGYVHGYQNKPEAAIPALEKSASLDPQQPWVWLNLVKFYRTTNRQDDSQRAYQQLLAIDPKLAEQTYHSYIFPFEGTP